MLLSHPLIADVVALFESTPADTLFVLTPNERLSRFVHSCFSAYQQERGKTAFASIRCQSLQSWRQSQWQRLCVESNHAQAACRLLSPLEEALLWEQVIEAHPQTPPLLNLVATARNARDAWQIAHEWQLDISTFASADVIQSHSLFAAWADAFSQRLTARQLLTDAQLPALLAGALTDGNLAAPPQLALYGFDDPAPAFTAVLAALATSGCSVAEVPTSDHRADAQCYTFTDSAEELAAVARWCYQQLATNPQQRIGVVVPDLSARRADVERHFNRVFDPQTLLPDTPQHAPGFNLSAGQPLAQVPVVQSALQALQLNRGRLPVEEMSAVVLSPFIGDVDELASRALLDVRIREEGELQPSRQLLKTSASALSDDDENPLCPQFYASLDRFDQLAKRHSGRSYLPSEWLPVFVDQLTGLGWPGKRTLDTLEYQQLQVWQSCLDEFAALDGLVDPMVCSDALSVLRRVLQQRSFQAQTRSSPLQILGTLEAAGLAFDQLWVLGLDDEAWPPAPSPNPLLPLALQIARGTPQSSAEREYSYARKLTRRWLMSARRVIFSHAQQQDDKQLLPSPLLKAIPTGDYDVPAFGDWDQQQFAARRWQTLEDTQGAPVVQAAMVRGGSAVLRDQAACPFQAYARHRLHTADIPQITVGLNAAERGNLLHKAMELIWRQLADQAGLLARSEQELGELVATAIDRALLDVRRKSFVGYRFVELESRRLAQLIMAWLALEKQRAPFRVVFNESREDLTLAGLPLRLRYDRVDALADGGLLVLDYKTGMTAIKAWEGERPDQPQVPLYAIANKADVVAAAFAQIHSREVAIKGLSDCPDVAPGLKQPGEIAGEGLPDNWQDLLAFWQQTLEQLAADFLAGDARVAPKIPVKTCQYCELSGFCRIRQESAPDPAEAL